MSKVITVNRQDKILTKKEKLQAHQVDGILHRGFIVLVKNKKGEILLVQRSKKKLLWPLYWDGCCSHPKPGETYLQAGERRLKEELGFTCPLKYLGKFYYRAVYQDVGSEEEICAVLTGCYNGQIKPNPEEIAAYRWLKIKDLKKEIQEKPKIFVPWLIKSLKFLPQEN